MKTLYGRFSMEIALTIVSMVLSISGSHSYAVSSSGFQSPAAVQREYIWFEAENMRGFATNPRGEPILNPSWLNLPKLKAPGWGINGPGVSAEWSQGGESEWNSAAASADETKATIYQDIEIPLPGDYNVWVRYADWARKSENFTVTISQNRQEVFRHEFGTKDVIDAHDEVSMYWGWAFSWDQAPAKLGKGPARFSIVIDKPSEARRHVDSVLITNDLSYVPEGRQKPDFAGMRYLRQWSHSRTALTPIVGNKIRLDVPPAWKQPRINGRDFFMPWNVAKEFWQLYDKPPAERPLYPFHAEPIEEFIQKYKGAKDVPIFSSQLVVPVIYINHLAEYMKEGSPFLRYLRETKSPFAILINYGSAQFSEEEGQAAWQKLTGEFKDQFLGWISGESIGYVWDESAKELKISGNLSRKELLEAHRLFYTNALTRKWSSMFHTETGAMWDKLIPAQSTSSTSFAHALSDWGVRLLGVETAAVQPMFAMRIAFTRGAVRQYGGAFVYYHAPNFGDTATTFTKTQNFAGPDNFFHSRYGVTMGPSLSWYRKAYYLYYMAGASAIYLEQGFDQFFKPGPGEHPFQLNPLGRITQEFMKFAERHPNRGTPYTPIAFLLDHAHGWDMTDYPHWPFGVSQLDRHDRALRELFGVAYYPGTVIEGEPATGDRQAFVSSVFGDIFDVVTAASQRDAIDNYRVIVAGGNLELDEFWSSKLADYVKSGGVLVINAAQASGLSEELLGVRRLARQAESASAHCDLEGASNDLSGQVFRYEKVQAKGARVLINSPAGDPLVTINQVGKGAVVYCALADYLGLDERITPFAAHLFAHLFSNAVPVKVNGDVEYLINRTNNGWVVTLINNNGVFKPQQGMASVDRSLSVTASIRLNGERIYSAYEWIGEKKLKIENNPRPQDIALNIAPGGIAIVELRTQ